MRALIERTPSTEFQTLGTFTLFDDNGAEVLKLHTLELPWKNNEVRVSCIPTGDYEVVPRTSPKYGQHFHVTNVPGRSYILIHPGNYHTQILGCILPGEGLADINNDGDLDVTSSRNALKKILNLAPDGFTLTVT